MRIGDVKPLKHHLWIIQTRCSSSEKNNLWHRHWSLYIQYYCYTKESGLMTWGVLPPLQKVYWERPWEYPSDTAVHGSWEEPGLWSECSNRYCDASADRRRRRRESHSLCDNKITIIITTLVYWSSRWNQDTYAFNHLGISICIRQESVSLTSWGRNNGLILDRETAGWGFRYVCITQSDLCNLCNAKNLISYWIKNQTNQKSEFHCVRSVYMVRT